MFYELWINFLSNTQNKRKPKKTLPCWFCFFHFEKIQPKIAGFENIRKQLLFTVYTCVDRCSYKVKNICIVEADRMVQKYCIKLLLPVCLPPRVKTKSQFGCKKKAQDRTGATGTTPASYDIDSPWPFLFQDSNCSLCWESGRASEENRSGTSVLERMNEPTWWWSAEPKT